MEIRQLTAENFHPDSLDSFDRYQVVDWIYVLENDTLKLVRSSFDESWSPERRREKAAEILSGSYIVFGAFEGGRVIGEIMLIPALNRRRMIVDSFHVSREFRRQGIGRALFQAAVAEAKRHHAGGLYISACSAKETIDFYLAMGCHVSPAPIAEYAEAEPCDIQLEYTFPES